MNLPSVGELVDKTVSLFEQWYEQQWLFYGTIIVVAIAVIWWLA